MASFISQARWSDIPEPARHRLLVLLLDGLANVIAGGDNEPSRIQHEALLETGGTPEATVLWSGARTTVKNAAFLNASAANMLDFDDTYKTFAHPGATSISPALAVAEHRDVNGEALLIAILVAYESQIRIAEAALPSAKRRREIAGFGVWQTLGAVAGSARVLGLDTQQTVHALGIGLFNAPVANVPKLGLGAEPNSWSKNNYGWASAGGIWGALLAERGFRGCTSVLDGTGGFWAMAGSDRFDADAALAGLGVDFTFQHTALKPYGSCRWSHSALDAIAELAPKLVSEVSRVEIHSFLDSSVALATKRPTDILQAQFSLPHLTALELMGRSCRAGLDQNDLVDPEVESMADRVHLQHDPAMDNAFESGHMPARVRITQANGDVLETERLDAWGSPTFPFTNQDAWSKFRVLVEPRLGDSVTREIADRVWTLDRAPSCRPLIELIASSMRSAR